MSSLGLQVPRIWPRRSQREEPGPVSFHLPSMLRSKPRSKSVDAHRLIRRRGEAPMPPPILHPIFSSNGSDVEIILDGPAPEPLRSHPPTHHSFPVRGGYDVVEVAPRRGRVPRREQFHSREPSRGRSPARVIVARQSSARERGTLVSYSPTRQVTIEKVHRPHSRSRSSRRSGSVLTHRSSSRAEVPVLHMEPLEGIGRPSRRSVASRTPSPARSRESDASPLSTTSPVSSISSAPGTPRRRTSSRGPPPLTRSPTQQRQEPLASVLEAPTPTHDGSPAAPLVRQRSYVRERPRENDPPQVQRTVSAPVAPGNGAASVTSSPKPARYRCFPKEDDHAQVKEYVRELERGGHRRARPASVPRSSSSASGAESNTSRRRPGDSGKHKRTHKRTQSASFIASETSVWPSPKLDNGHTKRSSMSALSNGHGRSRSRSVRRSVSFARPLDSDSVSVAPSDSASTIGTRAETKTPRSPRVSQEYSSRSRASPKPLFEEIPSSPPTSTRRCAPLGAAPKFSERFSVCLTAEPESSVDLDVASSTVTATTSSEKDERRMRRVRRILKFADHAPSE